MGVCQWWLCSDGVCGEVVSVVVEVIVVWGVMLLVVGEGWKWWRGDVGCVRWGLILLVGDLSECITFLGVGRPGKYKSEAPPPPQ